MAAASTTAASGHRGQRRRDRCRREQDAGHRHLPELLPHVQKAVRYDRYRQDGSHRVHRDLRPEHRQPLPNPTSPAPATDLPDSVYKTVNGKYNAVIEQVAECHAKGQPVLVGTVSVEKSEALSKLLKKKGIEHNVLNAKQHEREAEIVAQAGKQGAVTIATNMAGRGTDIMLGGNVTYMPRRPLKKELSKELTANLAELKDAYEHEKARAKASGTELPTPPEAGIDAKLEMLMTECDGHAETEDAEILHARKRFEELCEEFAPEVKREAEVVRNAGGLFIIGTERHESRRIDNQLRGRAGRQGDPGASRFFLSLEDDLMRIFGGDRVQSLMDSLGLDEDVPSRTSSSPTPSRAPRRSSKRRTLQFVSRCCSMTTS